MDANTMPGDAEAAAAIAAMNEIYISGWRPEPGDMVRVPRPFYGTSYIGRVAENVGERWLIEDRRIVVEWYGSPSWYEQVRLKAAKTAAQ
jgi:hypothetical protein